MYVLYYASMLRCWHLFWILVRTNHPCLGMGCHNSSSSKEETPDMKRMSPRKGRKEETIVIRLPITQCISIMIICLELSLTSPYPLAKLSILMELVITNGNIA
jgi:hypothetical protein